MWPRISPLESSIGPNVNRSALPVATTTMPYTSTSTPAAAGTDEQPRQRVVPRAHGEQHERRAERGQTELEADPQTRPSGWSFGHQATRSSDGGDGGGSG